MKISIFRRLAAFLFIFCVLAGVSHAGENKHLIILHTNDIHGIVFPVFDKNFGEKGEKLGGLANLASQIKRVRAEYPGQTILLDAGDMSQGTPVSNLFYGAPVTDYMNYIGYTAATFGNHEFDWSFDKMKEQVLRRKFPMICSNIVYKSNGKIPEFAKPYGIFKINGMKIGLIGVTTPDTPRMCFPKNVELLKFLDPAAAINKYRAELEKQGINIIGVISHCGYDEDKAVTEKIKGVDFIIGGHSHTPVPNPKMHNNVIVAQAGSWGKYLGFLDMHIDKDTGVVKSFKGKLIPIVSKDLVEDRGILKVLQGYQDKVKGMMSEVLGTLSADVSNRHTIKGAGNTQMGDLITDIVKERTGSDVVIYNTHGLRASMTKGPITRESVFMVLPFDNTIVSFTLKGSDLLKACEYFIDRPSYSQMSGITLDYDNTKPDGKRVSNVKVNGEPVNPAKVYKIASIDFLVSVASDFQPFKNLKDLVYGKNVRDEVEAYIKERSNIVPPEGIRIKVINGAPSESKRRH